MKKFLAIFCCVVFLLLAGKGYADQSLAFLYGEWEGVGKSSGMTAEIRHTWSSALGGRFTKLHLHNQMTTADGQQISFEGVAHYKVSETKGLTGVWIDSQGNVFPLRATLEASTLTAIWGTEETELGRSVYKLLPSGALDVVNSIHSDTDGWQVFGRVVLARMSTEFSHEK